MHKTDNSMMIAAGLTAAAATVAAAGYAASKNSRKMKKMARKVARGAEKAVLDMDRMLGRYYR